MVAAKDYHGNNRTGSRTREARVPTSSTARRTARSACRSTRCETMTWQRTGSNGGGDMAVMADTDLDLLSSVRFVYTW
jgi:hypothetical protein